MNELSRVLFKVKHRFNITPNQCKSLLKHCAATQSLTNTKQIHACIITSGFLIGSLRSILTMAYALCGYIHHAHRLFDEMSDRSVVLYNNMIRMYLHNGLAYDALRLFVQMLEFGHCHPDGYTYPLVIKACGDLSLGKLGLVVHGRTLRVGFEMDTVVQNSLLAMYMNWRERKAAKMVFDAMWDRSVVSWNAMISGYFKNGCAGKALEVFNRMVDSGLEPDHATVVSVLPACGYLKELEAGRRVHMFVENKGLGNSIVVMNALVDMYVKCDSMDEARFVFDTMNEKDVVTWTSMTNGYILKGDARSALALCRLMQLEDIMPNSVTIASLLSVCGNSYHFSDGKSIHGWAIRQKLESEVIVETALIDMYAKCKRIDLSFLVFARTSKSITSQWNALLSGYVRNDLAREAIELFKQMQFEAIDADDATLNSFLPSYTITGDLHQAMNVHSYVIKSGFLSSIEVATGLIDIYSKCGSLELAHNIFNGIPKQLKDIIVWSVIVAGYAMHGDGASAILLFRQMIQSGVEPNEVTFTSVLHACSHAGLVDEGLNLFKFMLDNHRATPCSDHYTCIVDLLGRAGRLNEAYDLIRTMPFRPNHAVWGALLGACVIHENVELGEVAAKWLFELEPDNTGNYVLVSKIYAASRRWKDVENVRNKMNEIGLRKSPAHSLIEVRRL